MVVEPFFGELTEYEPIARPISWSVAPKCSRSQVRSLHKRTQFRPCHFGMDLQPIRVSTEATVHAADDVFGADELCEADQPIRDGLRVLDDIGRRINDAWNELHTLRQPH